MAIDVMRLAREALREINAEVGKARQLSSEIVEIRRIARAALQEPK